MDELRRRLEFYRDLGIKELQIDTGAAIAAGPVAPPSQAQQVGDLPPAVPAPAGVSSGNALAVPPPVHATALFDPIQALAPEGDTLVRIQQDIGDCTRCRLHKGRHKIVFGSGNEHAKLVFVGEGPGADEDEQGLPFVGRAGQLLTAMIENTATKEGVPIRRGDVYICNMVKCRPPENRTPEPDEMEICGQFLYRQLLAIQPKAICALGSTAVKGLLGTREGITKLRGKWHRWRDIPLMPTYHPSYLLRPYNQDAKREAWEDLKTVLHFVYD